MNTARPSPATPRRFGPLDLPVTLGAGSSISMGPLEDIHGIVAGDIPVGADHFQRVSGFVPRADFDRVTAELGLVSEERRRKDDRLALAESALNEPAVVHAREMLDVLRRTSALMAEHDRMPRAFDPIEEDINLVIAKASPGPWTVFTFLRKPGEGKAPCGVRRTLWQQGKPVSDYLLDARGEVASFATIDEARAAIAKATGSAAS